MKSPVILIAHQEFILNKRNRWLHSFVGLFALLTLIISYFGMVTSGYSGFQDFTRTAASIISLGCFVIPLFALVLGVFSFLSNREYIELLVAQPVSRGQVLMGKYLGLVMTVAGSTLAGLGAPGVIISLVIGYEGAVKYGVVVLQSSILSMIFIGLSLLIVLAVKWRQLALGLAFGVWLFYELLYGVLMLGATLYFTPAFLKTFLLVGLLGNPIDITRVLSLLTVGSPHLFGPGGATLIKLTGSLGVTFAFAWMGLLLWIILPLLIVRSLFARQDL